MKLVIPFRFLSSAERINVTVTQWPCNLKTQCFRIASDSTIVAGVVEVREKDCTDACSVFEMAGGVVSTVVLILPFAVLIVLFSPFTRPTKVSLIPAPDHREIKNTLHSKCLCSHYTANPVSAKREGQTQRPPRMRLGFARISPSLTLLISASFHADRRKKGKEGRRMEEGNT